MGTEGGNLSFHTSSHWALYNEGTLTKRSNRSVAFTPVSGGATDWGLLYAQSSFIDEKHNNRRVQWGWAPEDILNATIIKQQGFQGSFGLPRQLFAHVAKGLSDPDGKLKSSGARVSREADGTYTASTLGMKPLEDVVRGIRTGSKRTIGTGRNEGSLHMEYAVTLTEIAGRAGLYIAASPSFDEMTLIVYDPSNHTIAVDRTRSSLAPGFGSETIQGSFYPYMASDGTIEDIRLRVFLDGSLLEVYANDRFALTTRIYPSKKESVGFGIANLDGGARGEAGEAWIGTRNIWPERPLNSSAPLVYDSPEKSNNYTVSSCPQFVQQSLLIPIVVEWRLTSTVSSHPGRSCKYLILLDDFPSICFS